MSTMFSVSPMSQAIKLLPGENYVGSIQIANLSDADEEMQYEITVVPYNVVGENYAIDSSEIKKGSQIAAWTSISETNVTAQPNETKTIDFTINVPLDAPGGTQTAALVVTPVNNQTQNSGVGINSTFAMNSVIYANVAGETREGGEILENNLPTFAITTPVQASAQLSNTGNVYETATFEIAATNTLTGEKINLVDSTDNEDNGNDTFHEIIMPETTRLVTREVGNLPLVGVVRLEQTIEYAGQTSVATQQLWICPIWFMASVAAVLMVLIMLVVMIVRKIRHRKIII